MYVREHPKDFSRELNQLKSYQIFNNMHHFTTAKIFTFQKILASPEYVFTSKIVTNF